MLLIGNGTVITRDQNQSCIPNGCVAIEGEHIVGLGDTKALLALFPQAEYIDVKSRLIMPGLINTHHHSYSTMARGISLPNYAPRNFLEILQGLWWKLDSKLSIHNCYYSALYTFMDCIKNGVTTVFDHHASYGAITDSLEAITRASTELGVRSCLCFEVSDRHGEESTLEAMKANVNYMNQLHPAQDQHKAMMGLHASFTLSDHTLAQVRELTPSHIGFHIHVAEDQLDVQDCMDRYHKPVLFRLFDHGLLGTQSITAHCNHINEEEMAILRDTQTNVVVNPESNMGNAVGCPQAMQMMNQYHIPIGLGTDGYTSDMFESWKVANLIYKHQLQNPNVGWTETADMLFVNNVRIANRFFSSTLGRLEEGAAADVIIVDYQGPTPLNAYNINAHLLFGANGSKVTDTIIAGKILMRNRELTDIDEAAIMHKVRESTSQLWKLI